jgi:hypothetical protein
VIVPARAAADYQEAVVEAYRAAVDLVEVDLAADPDFHKTNLNKKISPIRFGLIFCMSFSATILSRTLSLALPS